MKAWAYILLWSTIMILPACHYNPRYKDDFYNGDMVDAFKRLPLFKPYELVKNGSWEIKFQTSALAFTVDHIFVDTNRFIFGYGNNGVMVMRGDTSALIIYFLIDLKKKKELTFYDSTSFINELKKYDLSRTDLYSLERLKQIYSDYLKTGLLPWHSPSEL